MDRSRLDHLHVGGVFVDLKSTKQKKYSSIAIRPLHQSGYLYNKRFVAVSVNEHNVRNILVLINTAKMQYDG